MTSSSKEKEKEWQQRGSQLGSTSELGHSWLSSCEPGMQPDKEESGHTSQMYLFTAFILSSCHWHSAYQGASQGSSIFLGSSAARNLNACPFPVLSAWSSTEGRGLRAVVRAVIALLVTASILLLMQPPILSSFAPQGQAPCQNRQHQLISQD